MNAQKSTKVTKSRETTFALLLGFALAAWLKCDVQLYFALGAFLVGADVSFMFGKSKEYQRDMALRKPPNDATPGQPTS